MDAWIKSAVIALFGCGSAAVSAQQLMDAENLLFSPPKDFKVGYQSNRDNRLLTVQIYRGATVDSATFLGGVGKRYMDACPGTTARGPMNPGTGKPETTAFRVIKGTDALYSVQRAWRSVPRDQDLDEVMHALGKVTVCDTRTPEHPCPSFDSLVPN